MTNPGIPTDRQRVRVAFHEMRTMERESNCSCGHFCSPSLSGPDCFRVAAVPPRPAIQISSRETHGRNRRRTRPQPITANPATTKPNVTPTQDARTEPNGSDRPSAGSLAKFISVQLSHGLRVTRTRAGPRYRGRLSLHLSLCVRLDRFIEKVNRAF